MDSWHGVRNPQGQKVSDRSALDMKTARAPGIRKRQEVALCGYRICTIDALGVRESSADAEEFTLVGTRGEFPGTIPDGEVWISRRHFPREGIFLAAHALAFLGASGRGLSADRADQAGLDAERRVREDVTGEQFRDGRPHRSVPERIYDRLYATIPDSERAVKVWLIDGLLARCWYKTDYAEGGHYVVYPWVPTREIWLERDTSPGELPYILAHEYLELRMMRDGGLDYDHAHEIASKIEFELRREDSTLPLAPGRSFRKSDFPKLAAPEVFEFVRKKYL
jgi:hypothetical protein